MFEGSRTPNWVNFFQFPEIFRLLFSLQNVSALMKSEDQTRQAWCKEFYGKGGFLFLYDLISKLTTRYSPSDASSASAIPKEETISVYRACMHQILEILHTFIKDELLPPASSASTLASFLSFTKIVQPLTESGRTAKEISQRIDWTRFLDAYDRFFFLKSNFFF